MKRGRGKIRKIVEWGVGGEEEMSMREDRERIERRIRKQERKEKERILKGEKRIMYEKKAAKCYVN
jgi:hypothetical protein